MTAYEMQLVLKARDEASKHIANFRGELEKVSGSAGKAGSGFGGILSGASRIESEGGKHVASLRSQLEKVPGSAGAASSGISSLLGGLSKIGFAVFGVQQMATAIGGLATSLIDQNVELENAAAQMMAFTKDADITKNMIAALRKEADLTPFAFNEMAAAGASLIPSARAANVEWMSLVKTAEILAASHPEQGLRGAAFAIREAVSGDFMSIIDRFDLPRQYINQLKEEGVPNIEIVRRAMLKMGYDADLVASMANTLTGRWSTFADTLNSLKARLAEPIFDAIKGGLESAQKWFDSNRDTIDEWAANISAAISIVIEGVGMLATAFGQSLGAVLEIVSGVGQAIYEALSWLNPFASHSPALVSQVSDGVDSIIADYQRIAGIDAPLGSAAAALQDFKAAGKDALSATIEGTQSLVDAASERVGAMKDIVADTKDELGGLNERLRDARDALRGLGDVPIAGMEAFDSQLEAIETRSREVKLQLTQMKLAGAPKEQIEGLTKELDRLGLEADKVELEKRLKFDPMQKAIKAAIKPPGGAMAFEDIIKRAGELNGEMGDLEPAIGDANKRLADQMGILKPLEKAQDDYTQVLKIQRDALQDLSQAAAAAKTAGGGVKGLSAIGGGTDPLAAFKTAGKAVDEFKTKVGNARTGIESAFSRISTAIKGVGSGNRNLQTATHLLSGLAFAAGDIGTALSRGDLSGALGKFGRAIETWWIPFWRNTWRIIGDGIGAVGDIGSKVITWLYDNFRKIDWQEVWKVASGIGNAFVAAVGDIIGEVLTWLKDTWGKLSDKWPEIWATAGDIVGGLWTAAGDIAGGVLSWVKEAWAGLSDKWPEIWQAAGDIWSGLVSAGSAVTDWLGKQWEKINWLDVWANVTSIFATGLTYAAAAAKWLGDTWAAIDWSAVWGAVGNFFQGVANIAGQVATWLGLAWGAITAADWATIWGNVTNLGAGLLASGLTIIKDLTSWLATQFAGVDMTEAQKAIDEKPLHMVPVKTPATSGLQGWVDDISGILKGLVKIVTDFGGEIGTAWATAFGEAIKWATDGIKGLRRWLTTKEDGGGGGIEIDFKAMFHFLSATSALTDPIGTLLKAFFEGMGTKIIEHKHLFLDPLREALGEFMGLLADLQRASLPPLPGSTSDLEAAQRFTISPEGVYQGKSPPEMTYDERRAEERLLGLQHGGVVPGPIGSPRLAIVHGGEEFSGVGKRLPSSLRQSSTVNNDNRTVTQNITIQAPNPASVADRFISDPRVLTQLRPRPVW